MEWLSQNWIWLALGIGAVFMMSRGGGCCGGHGSRDPVKAGGRGTGDDVPRQAAPASDAGQPGTTAVADTASAGAGARELRARGLLPQQSGADRNV